MAGGTTVEREQDCESRVLTDQGDHYQERVNHSEREEADDNDYRLINLVCQLKISSVLITCYYKSFTVLVFLLLHAVVVHPLST